MSKNASVIGSGNVGQKIAEGLLKLDYEVVVGTRDKSKLAEWATKQLGSLQIGSFEDAAKHSDIIFFAGNWKGAFSAIDLAGKSNFDNKILVDISNPLDFSTGKPHFDVSLGNSAGEQIQQYLPNAKVVKAFNIVTANYMCNPVLKEGTADMFIAGNDLEAKQVVSNFALDWGWASCNDMGDISMSYWLETMAMFWIYYGFINNHWTHAFKLLKN
jgi:hypothetical protein